jgi:hypothetical protein
VDLLQVVVLLLMEGVLGLALRWIRWTMAALFAWSALYT